MAVSGLFQYPAGAGWIVLSGGADAGSVIRAQALRRVYAEGGSAYLVLRDDDADAALDDMDDLGAPTGYQVNLSTEDDDTIREQISAASLVVITAADEPHDLLGSLRGAAEHGLRDAYENGAVLLFEGVSAALLGAYWMGDDGVVYEGLNWLQNSIVLPATSSQQAETAQQFIGETPSAFVVGIGLGAALALGPRGAVEVWGDRRVSVALGRDYQHLDLTTRTDEPSGDE